MNYKEAINKVKLYKIDLTCISEHLNYKVESIKQNIKKSARPSEKFKLALINFINKFEDEKESFLYSRYKSLFSKIKLNIYSDLLPNIKISDIKYSPKLHANQQAASTIGAIPPSDWIEWKKELWERILNKNDNNITVIMGAPGSGKSTVLYRLLLDIKKDELVSHTPIVKVSDQVLPIYFPLSVYNIPDNNFRSIEQAVHYYYSDSWSDDLSFDDFLSKSSKKIVYFLDALDEISDVNTRRKVIDQLRQLNNPAVITSRYVTPRIDQIYESPYYVGGLSSDEIKNYINVIIGSFKEKLVTNNKEEKERYMGIIISLQKIIEKITIYNSINNCEFQNYTISPYKNTANRSIKRKGDELFSLEKVIALPIFANLLIASSVEKTGREINITGLLDRYLDFLIGKWKHARTNFYYTDGESISANDIHQVLSYIAFISKLTEHCKGHLITENIALHYLDNYPIDVYLKTKKEAFAKRIIDEAKTAQLIYTATDRNHFTGIVRDTNQSNRLRFGDFHEYLESIYSASFIRHATGLKQSISFSNTYKSHPSNYATLDDFLNNPNLRFLEESMVYYLSRKFDDPNVTSFELQDDFQKILLHPPLSEELTGLPHKSVEKIIPYNLTLLGRVFLDSRIEERHREIANTVHKKISNLFLNTNIEYVYQSLSHIHHAGNSVDPNNHFKNLDYKWRLATSSIELQDIIKKAKKYLKENQYNIITRRVGYTYRYHANTFRKKDFEWLITLFYKHEDKYNKENDKSGLSTMLLIFNTIKMICNQLPKDNSLKSSLESWINNRKQHLDGRKEEVIGLLSKYNRENFNIDLFLEEFIDTDKIHFHVKKIYPSLFIDILPTYHEKRVEIIQKTISRLNFYQKKHSSNTELEAEASCVLLFTYLAEDYFGQQYFLPSSFYLNDIAGITPPTIPYDSSIPLKLLFSGAERGLNTKANQKNYSIGGWQIYDIYTQAIWKILHYLPADANYEYSH